MTRFVSKVAVALIALAGAAGAANAQEVLASFSYDSLSGAYVASSATTGNFTASAVNGALTTGGFFQRTIGPIGTADFPEGFVSDANPANILLTMGINKTSATTADGLGTIVITDIDGDTFTATINGVNDLGTPQTEGWIQIAPGFAAFSGALSNIVFNTDDGQFNGYTGGWSLPLPADQLEGAIVNLMIGGGSNFFNTSYSGRAVGVSGQIVPAPGVIALLGLGGLAAGRRRR